MAEQSPGGDVPALVATTARAVAAADTAEDALAPVLEALRRSLAAEGVAILRTETGQLTPAATLGMDAAARPMRESELTPADGGGYPIMLGGRLEGVLLVKGVAPQTLASREAALAALIDLGAVALRAARRSEERREAELRSLSRLSESQTSATAAALGTGTLHVTMPDRYLEAVEAYGVALDRALEERAYRTESRLPDILRRLAEQLGFLRAGPRDVVEIHTEALRSRVRQATAQRAQAYVEEARVVVLELMGYLAGYYRGHAPIPRRLAPAAPR